MTKVHVAVSPEIEARIEEFVEGVDARLSADEPTADVVQEVLSRIHGDGDVYDRWLSGASLSLVERVRLDTYHPANTLTKGETWAEKDEDRFRESKPLRWLWTGFDASPLADNDAVALPFRQMLATHLFAEAGDDLKLFRGIRFPYGHNIEIGDRTVIHENVLLDDRGALDIGDGVSIADDAALHSHSHDIVDQSDVSIYRTVVDDDVRIASGAMVAAGSRVGENAMVGAKAIVRGDVPAHHVAVGTPAESVKVKPGWQSVAEDPGRLADNRERRRIAYDLPSDTETVDEFGRDRNPPVGVASD
ncbi:acyltransferase [Haloplanus aerogenes]|uniref:Acyltransferase n=1 Tax=Haloplanus aerogenes TaxID=660522 RepID=A0A3M0D9M0_9EURY|nr:acyltransferase [Haloplanus aerogenes]AZH26156.1 acyltransferase [Haloplanus aerogenes]RMB18391.1 maltose O-acetyltransferase [Haloplanus aerogenes]